MNAPLMPTPRVEPFFFDAEPGTRFSLYHAPAPQVPARGAILYIHPFAEELNKSRRMAALQARRFAAMGYAVLQIDLFGCGDSCGDFSAARWQLWQRDIATARAWLAERCDGPMHLWGLRLGGLLALDVACQDPVDGIILWQPFLRGRSCIDQYLREHDPSGVAGSAALRGTLLQRGTLEVGGYELSEALVAAIDACDAFSMRLPPCHVHWFASCAPGAAAAQLAARAARLARRWAAGGAILHFHPLEGLPFWGPNEIIECPVLLRATSAVIAAEPP